MFASALAAGAGLTALLQANRVLFDALHIIGAFVLIWLGVIQVVIDGAYCAGSSCSRPGSSLGCRASPSGAGSNACSAVS